MGFSDLLRRAGPVLDIATGGDEEGAIPFLRRIAQSKIFNRPTYRTPPFVPAESKDSFDRIQIPDLTEPPIDAALEAPSPALEPRAVPNITEPPRALPVDAATPLEDTRVEPALYRRAPFEFEDNALVMPKPTGNGRYEERVIEPGSGRILGMGDERDYQPLAPVNIDPALRRRANEPLPTDTALAPRPVAPPLLYDAGGRPLKPKFEDPASDAALMRREEYIRALEQYKPVNRNSRIKSTLLGAGRGALIGLSQGPGGAIGGALMGGGIGTFNPASDEEWAKRQDLAEAQQQTGRALDFRKKTSDLATEVVDRDLKRAQAERALNPRYKPDVETDASGNLLSIQGGVATPITDAKGNRIRGKQNSKHEWRNDPFTGRAELWEVTPGGSDKKVPGALDASRDLVKTSQGWVKPGTALTADAMVENRDYNRNRQQSLDTRHVTERREDIDIRRGDKDEARLQRAAGVAAEVTTANAEAGKWQNMAAQTQDPNTKAYYESLAASEKQKAVGKAQELNQAYGDLYEAGPGDGGWAYVKPRPQPALQTRPSSGKIQPNEDPDVRAYANQYFKGDYNAAVQAIKKQKNN